MVSAGIVEAVAQQLIQIQLAIFLVQSALSASTKHGFSVTSRTKQLRSAAQLDQGLQMLVFATRCK
jgi:hypothetical protein